MKKTIPIFVVASLLFITSSAQENKPIPNSFGIQYGISYNGLLNQSLIFSGWLDHGIEVRGGMLLSFSQSDTKSGNSATIDVKGGGQIGGYTTTEGKSGSLTITPNISVLKHFNTKSNIDPFIGGLVSTGINFQTIQSQSITETTGDNYYRYINTMNKTPIVTTVGLSLIGGVNYFFAKNFAIGVDAGFGFTTGISKGKRYTNTLNKNSGSNNPSSNNSQLITSNDYTGLTSTLNLSGSGGLRFTYYIPSIKIKKENPAKI